MPCPCCVQGPQCCCVGNDVTIVQSAQDCTGNIASLPSTAVPIDKISFVVDWDGLTGVTDGWFQVGFGTYGGSINVQAGVDFSCQKTDDVEPFYASSRSFFANFFGNTSFFGTPNCARFDANASFFFTGTYPSSGGYTVAQHNFGFSLSVCQRQLTVTFDSTTSSWCPNPFGNSFTIEMIIAP